MSPKILTFIFLISFAFTELAAWTIDLPEARKYFFEKAEEHKKNEEIKKDFNEEKLFFDNIVPDSPHNKEELEHSHETGYQNGHVNENDVNGDKHADDYEYMSYMEKKVHNIVYNGSVYLEGLRRALENYGDLLMNCSRANFTQPRSPNGPWLPENERPMPPGAPTPGNFPQVPDFDPNNPSPMPNFGPGNFTQMPNGTFFRQLNQSLDADTCERATRYSEHVRRIAALALWATRELQDRTYASKYEKQSHDEEEEEAELLLRLAFFLDRLAFLTGYEPRPQEFFTTTTPRPSVPTIPMSVMGEVSEDAKTAMMNCIWSNSTAPDKCRFPQTSPEFLQRLFNMTDSPQSVRPASSTPRDPSLREIFSNPTPPPSPPPAASRRRLKRHLPQQRDSEFFENDERDSMIDDRDKRGILTTALLAKEIAHKIAGLHEDRSHHEPGFHRRKILMAGLAALKNGGRKLIEKMVELRHEHGSLERSTVVKRDQPMNRQKRSADDNPALQLMKYYVKHQVWANSNPAHTEKLRDYDVENHLTAVKLTDEYQLPTVKVQKRSIDKNYENHLPEDPFMDISAVAKQRPRVNYVRNQNEAQKLHEYLGKISHSSSATAKDYVRKLLKKHNIKKRSIKYENKFLPSKSQNPRQDISYYVKNKEGTEDNVNLAQAAAVRAGLEFIFQNPNIEVVRRYGSNFNPVQFPLAVGLVTSFFVDI